MPFFLIEGTIVSHINDILQINENLAWEILLTPQEYPPVKPFSTTVADNQSPQVL